MFERFTPQARRVVVRSQDTARELNHNYIGTEHLLLALLEEREGIAPQVLGSLGVSLIEARTQVEEIIGRGTEVTSGALPFTPRAKKVLELSLREALQLGPRLGHRDIGPEHLLLGLIREGDGVASRVLTKLGADMDRARTAVVQLLEEVPAEEPAGKRPLQAVVNSLEGENRRLRAEVDHLRRLLLELGAEGSDVVPEEPPDAPPEEPPEVSPSED